MFRKSAVILGPVAFVAIFAVAAYSAIPQKINFQGRLTDASGNPLTGSYPILFSIWDAGTAGAQLWSETQTVAVSTGIYTVALGDATAISTSIFSGTDRWLQIKVGADAAMTPRLKLQSVAYAMVAESANTAASLSAASGFGVAVSTNLVIGAGTGMSTFTATGNLAVPGAITAGQFVGNGSGLTNLPTISSNTATLDFPDGLAGLEPVNQRISLTLPYTVPSGRNFYLVGVSSTTLACDYGDPMTTVPFSCHLTASGATNILSKVSYGTRQTHNILGPGTVLASTSTAITFDIIGFTVPASVTVVLTDIAPSGTYTVPAGKIFYLAQQAYPNSAASSPWLTANGVIVTLPWGQSIPYTIGPGKIITNTSNGLTTINGYLKPQ